MRQTFTARLLGASVTASAVALPAYAGVMFNSTGTSSNGDPVSFKAELTISGDQLTVQLWNNSGESINKDDLLSSFYFDIAKSGGFRPTLTYSSASGDVYRTDKSAPDTLQTAGMNLVATNPGDDTWQFRTMDPTKTPALGFGIGTAGNSSLSPNNFDGNIVGGIDYGIYASDATDQSLNNLLLVKDTATFTFTGVSGFAEADIKSVAAFRIGHDP